MQDSVFTKIIRGEIPCHKVYEDEHTFAFLDIHPVQPGMVLVVTKKPSEDFTAMSDEELANLMRAVKKVALKLKQVFPAKKRIGVALEGLDVAHTHVKLFPIDSGDEFRAEPNMQAEPDHAALAALAQQLKML
jgi:histidine triad (HIT) family protein